MAESCQTWIGVTKKLFVGVGKTTLIKQLITKLIEVNIEVDGFLTEEIRNDRRHRTGFSVRSIKHNVSRPLADKSDLPASDTIQKLGQYTVYVKDFEDTVIDSIIKFEKGILVIDEIGKMELFSKKFEQAISNAFKNKKFGIVATVPIKGPPFVEGLKRDVGCHVFTVTRDNRSVLLDDIFKAITGN